MQTVINDNRGFSLLEVILAVSVLTVGILAMGVLQTSSVSMNKNARGITEASAWATDTMENIMALSFTDPDIDANTSHSADPNNKVLPTNPEGYTITYIVGAAVNNMKTISVTVSWSNLGTSGSQRAVTLNFIKARLI